ncbi:MAG: helix-turn-helix domain-containing protein [Longimicrobiales bacterium]
MNKARFSGIRLRTVRHFHQMTQDDLAQLIAVSPSTISLYETEKREPNDDGIIEALCEVLDVSPHFFYTAVLGELGEDQIDYRSLAAAPKHVRDRLVAFGFFVLEWTRYLRQKVRLPTLNIPSVDAAYDEDVERAAELCREHWGLGFGPIDRINRVLENAGVAIATVDIQASEVDAFSVYLDDMGLVVLNTTKGCNSRAIQDCTHELGHGVLHRGPGRERNRRLKEQQAKRFAGAFLLPRRTFPREFWSGGHGDLSHVVALKRRWGVSIQSILYRAHQLELIGTAAFRRWMRTVSAKGWRSGIQEPAEPRPVEPELLGLAFEQYKTVTGESASDAAQYLGWGETIFRGVIGAPETERPSPGAVVLSLRQARNS